jgi:hypothetical protein
MMGVIAIGRRRSHHDSFAPCFLHATCAARPVTIVSGPEIMDKFVGSSEKNLRAIFDNPPDVYDFVKKRPDGEAIAKAVRFCFLSLLVATFMLG